MLRAADTFLRCFDQFVVLSIFLLLFLQGASFSGDALGGWTNIASQEVHE